MGSGCRHLEERWRLLAWVLAVEIEGYGWTDRGGVLEEEMPRHVAGLVMGLGCFAS